MQVVVDAFIVGLLVAAAGDAILALAMRSHAPTAFAAAGSPAPGLSLLLTPLVWSPYHRFIITRQFKEHLQQGGRLYLAASVLFVVHALAMMMAVAIVAMAIASSLRQPSVGG